METLQIFILVMVLLLVISNMYMYLKFKQAKDGEDGVVITSTILPGTIVMWDSNVAPKGWAICDGSQGTPDLTGKFVSGAGASTISGETKYELHQEGGKDIIALKAENIPSHEHQYKGVGCEGQGCPAARAREGTDKFSGGYSWNNTPYAWWARTEPFGEAKPFNIMNPYYALTYIMKI